MAWNSQKNTIFFQRVSNVAYTLQSISEEIERLRDIYLAEGLGTGDPAYVDTNGLTVADVDAMVAIVNAYRDFLDNGVVPTEDRRPTIAMVLAARSI